MTFSAALFLPVSLYLLSAYGWRQWNFQWRSGRFKPSEYRQVREEQRLNHFPRSALITRQEKNQNERTPQTKFDLSYLSFQHRAACVSLSVGELSVHHNSGRGELVWSLSYIFFPSAGKKNCDRPFCFKIFPQKTPLLPPASRKEMAVVLGKNQLRRPALTYAQPPPSIPVDSGDAPQEKKKRACRRCIPPCLPACFSGHELILCTII